MKAALRFWLWFAIRAVRHRKNPFLVIHTSALICGVVMNEQQSPAICNWAIALGAGESAMTLDTSQAKELSDRFPELGQ